MADYRLGLESRGTCAGLRSFNGGVCNKLTRPTGKNLGGLLGWSFKKGPTRQVFCQVFHLRFLKYSILTGTSPGSGETSCPERATGSKASETHYIEASRARRVHICNTQPVQLGPHVLFGMACSRLAPCSWRGKCLPHPTFRDSGNQ